MKSHLTALLIELCHYSSYMTHALAYVIEFDFTLYRFPLASVASETEGICTCILELQS